MSNIKSPISFEILETGDGSPTLSLNGGEKMHSMEGALSESLYIYGECLDQALQQCSQIRLLSMGLGLGYNEWMAIAQSSKSADIPMEIHSFESQGFLITALQDWLDSNESPLTPVFDKIVTSLSENVGLTKEALKKAGRDLWKKDQWIFHGPLEDKNPIEQKFNVILYDAFSSETDEHLWTEEHLNKFISDFCDDESCFFSTYAATGRLKRALKNNGFLLKKKAGFGKKRESTLAIRLNQK